MVCIRNRAQWKSGDAAGVGFTLWAFNWPSGRIPWIGDRAPEE